MIAVVFALGAGVPSIFIAITAVGWVTYTRIVRGEVLVASRLGYIQAMRVAGLSTPRILFRHLAPNVITQAIVYAMSDIVLTILAVVTLGFLGLGVQLPAPEWGSMMAGRVRVPVAAPAAGDRAGRRADHHRAGAVADRRRPRAGAEPRMSLLRVTDLSVGVRKRGGRYPDHQRRQLLARCRRVPRAGRRIRLRQDHDPARGAARCSSRRSSRSPGRIEFDSTDLLALPPKQLRTIRGNRISVIWQDPQSSLDPVMRVGDQIIETIRAHEPVSRQAAITRTRELMAKVGLPERVFGAFPHELSGGQRQRVVIASAISTSPAVLLADEPTTALDVTVQATVLELLAELRAELGLAMLLVSHDIAVVANTCDSIAVMYAGRIVESGPTPRVLGQPRHHYTAGLLASAPDVEHVGRRPRGIPGAPPTGTAEAACAFAPRCPAVSDRCRSDVPVLAPGEPGRPDADPAHVTACFHPAIWSR